ncbi:MAG: hypothetical protein R2879_10965 [Saprospiraceae bacterium]
MVTALIIAAMIQLGIISEQSQFNDTLYQQHKTTVDIIIEDDQMN